MGPGNNAPDPFLCSKPAQIHLPNVTYNGNLQ